MGTWDSVGAGGPWRNQPLDLKSRMRRDAALRASSEAVRSEPLEMVITTPDWVVRKVRHIAAPVSHSQEVIESHIAAIHL
jgi:hypothetical protein